MPPVDTSPQSQIRYFKKLLAALVVQAGGELRIPQKFIREVASETSPQGLFEDSDTAADELVLRFGSKLSAVYTVEPEPCASPTPRSPTSPQPSPQVVDPLSRPIAGRPPLTDEKLAQMERAIMQRRARIRMKHAQEQNNSFETSEQNFPV